MILSDSDGFPNVINHTSMGAETSELCEQIGETLKKSQIWLFKIGADVAGMPRDDNYKLETDIRQWVSDLEAQIDVIDAKLSPLKNFILPGGTPIAAKLHVARAVVRRGEREVIAEYVDNKTDWLAVPFLNRLSDYLFVLARFHNSLVGIDDVIWES